MLNGPVGICLRNFAARLARAGESLPSSDIGGVKYSRRLINGVFVFDPPVLTLNDAKLCTGGMMSVEAKVKQIIIDQLSVDEKEVTPEASFVEDLGADSLDLTELIMAMEEEFNVEIGDEDALKILKVKDAYKYIADHAK